MKNILVLLIAIVLFGCKDRERKFQESEFERGASFACDFVHFHNALPSYYLRQKVYESGEWISDSIARVIQQDYTLGRELIYEERHKFDTIYIHDTIWNCNATSQLEYFSVGYAMGFNYGVGEADKIRQHKDYTPLTEEIIEKAFFKLKNK